MAAGGVTENTKRSSRLESALLWEEAIWGRFSKVLVVFSFPCTWLFPCSILSEGVRLEKRTCFLPKEAKSHFALLVVHCLSWAHCSSNERTWMIDSWFSLCGLHQEPSCILLLSCFNTDWPKKTQQKNIKKTTTTNDKPVNPEVRASIGYWQSKTVSCVLKRPHNCFYYIMYSLSVFSLANSQQLILEISLTYRLVRMTNLWVACPMHDF